MGKDICNFYKQQKINIQCIYGTSKIKNMITIPKEKMSKKIETGNLQKILKEHVYIIKLISNWRNAK